MSSWSPDGRQIVYQSVEDGNHDLWIKSAAGNERKQLTDREGYDGLPDWSPDGQWVAFVSDNWVWRVAPAGGEPERLSGREGILPQWDPNGKTLYFVGELWRNEYWGLSLEDRTERLVADLSGKPGRPGGMAFATDGEYLYFTWEETLGDIWVMDVVWDE